MKNKGKSIKIIKAITAVGLLSTAVFCIFHRLPECFASQDPAALAAAAFTLTNGEYKLEQESVHISEQADNKTETQNAKTNNNTENNTASSANRDKSDYYDSYADHGNEAKYSVAEKTIGGVGTAVDNCYVKNKTGLSIDFDSLLAKALPFEIKKNTSSPQVLIYHTHTSEAYMDEDVDFFYDSYYSRTNNNNFNVVAVGDAIADMLNKKGIKTIHDKTVHDTTYNGSYTRSAQTIQSNMEKYKDIKVVLDIHRDAVGTDECKVKTVFTHNGIKGAQIMILSGCDTDGEMGFDRWQNNLDFALKLQNTAESMYPGMTRPLCFDYFAYNEYICDGSLLIEVGTEANSIDEAIYTGKLLGNVLSEVLCS